MYQLYISFFLMATPVRFELTHRGVKFHCLTTWLRGNMAVYKGNAPFSVMWQTTILTFELIDHIILKFKICLFGAPRRTRTFDLVLNRHSLCQLSYRGINHEGGNPHIIYGLDAFGQFCRIFHHHHVSHASAAALSIRRSVRSVSPKSFFANWRRLYFLRKIFEKAGNP